MRVREPLVGVVLLVAAVAAVGWLYPALDDLWVENPGWNGLSEFYGCVDPVRVQGAGDLVGVDPSNSTLFIVGPSRGFSEEDVAGVRRYLVEGGRVVLLDDFGSGNELLEGLGVGTRFNGSLLRDSVFFDPAPEFPRLLNFSTYMGGEVLLNYGSVLSMGEGAQVLVKSSPFSYVEDGSGVELAAHPVVARIRYGGGVLVLVSDSSVWLNCMIDRVDNRLLLERVVRGVALVDVGHSVPTRLLAFKWWLGDVYGFLSVAEARYGVALLMVYAVFRVKLEGGQVEVDEVGEILVRHPDWSRERLMWLKERLG